MQRESRIHSNLAAMRQNPSKFQIGLRSQQNCHSKSSLQKHGYTRCWRSRLTNHNQRMQVPMPVLIRRKWPVRWKMVSLVSETNCIGPRERRRWGCKRKMPLPQTFTAPPPLRSRGMYKAGLKSGPQVGIIFQVSWGRCVKQQQEQNSTYLWLTFLAFICIFQVVH